MALNVPVPEGGTAGNLVVLSDDAHELTDRKLLEATEAWNPDNLTNGNQVSKDFTVEGAVLGDFAMVGAGIDVTDLIVSAVVTLADTVTVTLANETGGPINLPDSTWRILVIGQGA